MLFFHQICKHRFTIIIYMHLAPPISKKRQKYMKPHNLSCFSSIYTLSCFIMKTPQNHIYIYTKQWFSTPEICLEMTIACSHQNLGNLCFFFVRHANIDLLSLFTCMSHLRFLRKNNK